MRSDDRTALRNRFDFRCGYCGVSETDVGAELTVDHFQPGSRGGLDELANWVYCCHACNEFKGDYWEPESPRRILHPLRDERSQHLREGDDGTLIPLTETGAFHIEQLRLNRSALLAHRREFHLLQAARQSQEILLERLAELDEQLQALSDHLRRIENETTSTE